MTQLNIDPAPRPDLDYPFERGFAPEPGQPYEVAEGVFWLRMPLPMSLNHINLWLLRDGEQWTIVDCGFDDPRSRETWEMVFADFMSPSDVSQIIVTHYHPDHIGLASWLAHRCDCKVHITRGEFSRYRSIIDRASSGEVEEAGLFLHEMGFSPELQKTYQEFFKVDEKPREERLQHEDCIFVQEGHDFHIGGQTWRIVMGNGHSPEHACLYNAEQKLMISGDQALPRISSNVSVYYTNRDQNPLADWLDSCARLKQSIPADTLILPAHQEPFIGIDKRMQQLIDDHVAQLNKLRLRLTEPKTAAQAHTLMFERELSDIEILLATGETLAHLNYLLNTGEIAKEKTADGQAFYSLVAASSAA